MCVRACVRVGVCVGGYICTYVYIRGTLAEFIILRRFFYILCIVFIDFSVPINE